MKPLRAVEGTYARFAGLRRCSQCGAVLEETPARPPYCARCESVAIVPPHGEWPAHLKLWALGRFGRQAFRPWYAAQDAWERLVADEFRLAGGIHANPYGAHVTAATSPADVFSLALQLSTAWESAGRPIDLLLAPPRQLLATLGASPVLSAREGPSA